MREKYFFVDKIKEIKVCDNVVYKLQGSEYRLPDKDFIKLESGIHNFRDCEICQKQYEHVLGVFRSKLLEFPFCCKYHRELENLKEFDKKDFLNLAEVATDKLFYSYDFILKNIDEDNWYFLINEYLYYMVSTFGVFPKDKGEPLFLSFFLNYVERFVKIKLSDIEYEHKVKGVIEIMQSFRTDKNKSKDKRDLHILLDIYNKWYKIFPFDLVLFKDLKTKFSNTLPLFEKVTHNQYLGSDFYTLLTKKQLLKILEDITLSILSSNSLAIPKLYEQSKIDDLTQYQLQLLNERRFLELNRSKSPGSFKNFISSIKTWLKEERIYIDDIKSIIPSGKDLKETLLNDILSACNLMQENKNYWNKSEDEKNKQILDLLSVKYRTKDQPTYGLSSGGKRGGAVDGVVYDFINTEYFIEGLNLLSIDKTNIHTHINKLEKNYDSKGLKNKFLIVYYSKGVRFEEFCSRYYDYIETDYKFEFELKNIEKVETNYVEQMIIRSTHLRNDRNVYLYHILLNIRDLSDFYKE